MRSLGVGRVVQASFPNFVQKEEAGIIKRVVQVVLQAALFLASGRKERANFCFEQKVLAFLRAQ